MQFGIKIFMEKVKRFSVNEKEFWKKRSENYNNLSWVKDSSFLSTYIQLGDFNKMDLVLDIGTGTGIIADAVLPLVNKVIGIDISQDMGNHAKWGENKQFIRGDIRKTDFLDEHFDKVTARMVFHHIIKGTQDAMDECYRVLKKGGKIILSEGIPPSSEVKNDYIEIFKLKEERLTFMKEDLVCLAKNSGFKNIKLYYYIMEQMSIKNWLENSSLPKENQDKIFDLHVNGSDVFKKAYNLTMKDDDCLINIKKLILVGEK